MNQLTVRRPTARDASRKRLGALVAVLLAACSAEPTHSSTVDGPPYPPASPQVVNTAAGNPSSAATPNGTGPGGTVTGPGTAGSDSNIRPGTEGGNDAPTGDGSPATTKAFAPPPGSLRRLTATQFRNTVSDIFGVTVDTTELDSDNWNADFAVIGAATVVTSERGVEQYHSAIEAAANAVFDDVDRQRQFTGCDADLPIEDPCVGNFIERMGRRAWRRPLDASELERLWNIARAVADDFDAPQEGLRWTTVALFTSPHFLYRTELGTPKPAGGMALTGYEMASRLAFLIGNSAPDDVLLDDAAKGALDTADGVRVAAERLLSSSRGRAAVGAFAEEYLQLHRVGTQAKDAALFPEYGAALQGAMARDMRETWEQVVFDDAASALDLFTTRRAVVNADLAALYGLDVADLDSDTFETVTLPEDSPRVGILGKAAFLSQFANQKEGSPTLRGKFIRQTLMCTPIPPPPGDVDVVLDEPPADMPMTKRERLELHRSSDTCAGCHALMDPLGLPFETFDAIGRHRTTERGLTIDPSGEVEGQAVADSRQFGAALASSDAVAKCLVRKYYSYATGHAVRGVDLGVLDSLSAAFAASGYDMRDLILNVVSHEAFSSVAPQPDLETTP